MNACNLFLKIKVFYINVEVGTTQRESAQQKEQVKCLTLDHMVVIYLVQICFVRLAYLTPQLTIDN